MKSVPKLFLVLLLLAFSISAYGDDWNEFKIKRETNFKFTKEPVIKKDGTDKYVISFETASFCDVTIVIEEKKTGRIIRHLASGVLGKNAPKIFQKSSKTQQIIWDSKNDKGMYIKEINRLQVRVSLGLKPLYEKSLFNSPEQRFGRNTMRIKSTKAGVYVYDGGKSWDFVKMYDHNGKYLKTIYPLSASVMSRTKGFDMRKDPSGKGEFPVKGNFLQNTFFKGGSNFGLKGNMPLKGESHFGMFGKGVSFLAVNDHFVSLGMSRIHTIGLKETNRLFYGSIVSEKVKLKRSIAKVTPTSAALSPDGSKLYLTGYHFCHLTAAGIGHYNGNWNTLNMVKVVDLKTGKSRIFKGNDKVNTIGSDNNSFSVPIHVATDAKGRVYVADFYNDRVQVFSGKGNFLKSIKSKRPTYVTVLNKSKDIVIATFGLESNNKKLNLKNRGDKPVVISFMGSYENPVLKSVVELPKSYMTTPGPYMYEGEGLKVSLNVNDDLGDIRIWVCKEAGVENKYTRGKGVSNGLSVYRIKNKKPVIIKAFQKVAVNKLKVSKVNAYGKNRIYVNPKTGTVFMPMSIRDDGGIAFKTILEINPETEKIKTHKPYFDAEDMAFDIDGFIYLKTSNLLARFTLKEWKEVPFDYGIEAIAHTDTSSARVVGKLVSGVKLPFSSEWHHGGFYITPKGSIVISGSYDEKIQIKFEDAFQMHKGRNGFSKTNHLVHVFDKHGKPRRLDLLRGLSDIYGVGMDDDFNYYVMSGATRILDGKKYENGWSGALLKLPYKPTNVLTTSKKIPLPLDQSSYPKKPADVVMGSKKFWVNDAEWFYGAVGFAGKNAGVGCACFNARMTFDYLNRSFVPELERYSVAVLDSAGNLICRIGKYGNANSQGPKSAEPLGGDEVGLVHGAYLATLTDKKLYIADQANSRIVSVNLNYHVNKIISLSN